MEINVRNLSEESLNHLKERLFGIARDYEPWADMMYLGGASDPGIHQFPLDLEDVERIDITMEGGEET